MAPMTSAPLDIPEHLFVAIDRTSKLAFAKLEKEANRYTASDFLRALIEAVPYKIHTVLTDNGIQFAEQPEFGSEGLGLIVAAFILLISFGSVLAMGLPILTAVVGLAIGTGIISLLSNVLEVPEFAPLVAAMIGIGVGIDYALLIVTRYREQLHAGHDIRESIGIAMDTAGRAVTFAGFTVVISLLGAGIPTTPAYILAITVGGSTINANRDRNNLARPRVNLRHHVLIERLHHERRVEVVGGHARAAHPVLLPQASHLRAAYRSRRDPRVRLRALRAPPGVSGPGGPLRAQGPVRQEGSGRCGRGSPALCL